MRLQFSLLSIMILIACVAVGCVALVRPTFLWASATWSLSVAILALAIVVALARRGRTRCFWASFALLGWCYLILRLSDSMISPGIPRHAPLLDWLGDRLGHKIADPITMPGIWPNLPYARDPSSDYVYLAYLISGHSLIALLVGIGGGSLGSLIYNDREERTVTPHT